MRTIPIAVAVLLLSIPGVASEEQIPLKNWPVTFDSLLRARHVQATRPFRFEVNAVPSAASHFIATTPCRVLDTRNSGSPLPPNSTTAVDVVASGCGIPPGAAGYSMNFTAMNPADNGYLTAYPTGSVRPTTATLSYLIGGPAFDNAAIVPAGTGGAIDVYVAASLHLILDINGYFVEGVVTGVTTSDGLSGGGSGGVTLGISDGGIADTKLATITTAGKVANSATTATSANTAGAIVARDGSGGFAAGALTLSGRVDQDSVDGLVAKGTVGHGVIPASGAGTRLMWYPKKGAFRAGHVNGTQWDDASTGAYSTAMGYDAIASGTASLAVGGFTTASADFSTVMGSFASSNGMAGAFVYGDASTTTLIAATATNQFRVRAAGGVEFYSSSGLTTGVSLSPGGASWASVSDRERKEEFRAVDGEDILGKLAVLPVTSWRYKDGAPEQRFIGPVAQDFHATFGLGDDKTIATLDVDGVTLAAVKALEQRTRDLQTENAALRDQLTLRDQAHEKLLRRIERLETRAPAARP